MLPVTGPVPGPPPGVGANRHPAAPFETVLVSRVTAPVWASARPHGIFTPVVRVILERARMLPAKEESVPRVAELPTCQKTRSPFPPFVNRTEELLAVVRVLPT